MSLAGDAAAAQAGREKPPAGWEPYAEEAERVGSAIVRLPRPGATERDLLVGAGFDPDCWRIKGSVNTRRWMRFDQEWLYYYKFEVEQGESPEQVAAHVDELTALIRSRRGSKGLRQPVGGTDAFGFLASDWQVGKREGQDGTPQTVERVVESIELARDEVRALRRRGHRMPVGAIAGLGDLGEGTCGFYPNQQFLIDCNRREQNRIVRELLTYAIEEIGPLFETLRLITVGGNHGENRDDGRKVTDDGDNDDVAQFEAVKEAFDRDPRWAGQLEWTIPDDELSVLEVLGGVPVGFTHGHLFGKGSTPQQKALEWWKSQDFGFQPIRGAQVLCSAHFHHASLVSYGRRTHIQTPPMDPGSRWFRNVSGQETPAGAMTLRFDSAEPLGFDNLRILGRQHR